MHNLDLVQMAHAKDKRPAEISGGMKQRVGLARALAMEPKVLLLDEPFGALDALTRAHLQDSVMAIHQKLGNTVLMITHDVDEAVLLSDRIVMMTNGPAARIGEILDVPLPRPRKRLELAADATYLQVPPARARVPLRAPPLRRSGGRLPTCREETERHDAGRRRTGADRHSSRSGRSAKRAAGMFYGRLFEIAPEVRPLFKGDMAEQGRKLMATLAVVDRLVAQPADNPPAVEHAGEEARRISA